ncbi:MAG: hypothetical protein IJ465_01955, partial [Clostridia bacterium]|nr:hypothetical protein [Clostridia bacterium]
QDEGFKLLADGGTLTLTSGYGHIIANNGYSSIIFDDAIAGVDVVGGTYDLKVSIVYEGTVIKLGLWFNDVLYNNEYFRFDTANKGSDNFGTWLAYRSDSTGTVVINSKRPTPAPPTGLTELGWYDFEGLENATYPAVAGDLSGRGTYDGSLDGTLLSGDICMGVGTQLRYAGNDGWQGLVISLTADDCLQINSSTFGTAYNKTYSAGTFGLATFMGTTFNLKISVDIDDSGENYTFGVWVNNEMAGNYFTLAKGDHKAGSMIGLYDNNSGNAITLSGAVQTIPTFPTDYTVYTPASGNIADGAYKLERDDANYDVNAGAITGITNFNESALVFEKITFEGCLDMNFFGSTADLGFKWRTNGDGTVTLTSGYGELLNETLTDAIAGVDLVGGTYKLAFTLLYTSETTVKLGVWINDTLYNGEYFKVDLDVANDKLGNVLFAAIATYDGGVAAITFGEPIVIETLPDYTVVRPYDFGISDAIYYGSDEDLNFADMGALNTGATSLDEHIVAFDSITFTGDTQLSLMGTETLWNSLRFMTSGSGDIGYVTSGYGEMLGSDIVIDDGIAGVDVVGGTYSLKFSFKFVGDGTMKLGVWFNDVLYNNEYITVTIEGMANDAIGTYVGIYPRGNGSCVKLQSADWPVLPGDLVNTNPSSFGMAESTKYQTVEGTFADVTTLIGTSFRANVTFHYDGNGDYYMCYGGTDAGSWYGLRFYLNGDQMVLNAPASTEIWGGSFELYAGDFGLASFMDTPLEFGVDAVEYNNDVLLYVYINDVLYNDRPLVIDGFAGAMTNALVMHASVEGNYYDLGAITRNLPDLYHNLVESDYIAADGQTITLPGVTEVTYTDGASNYVQTIITYIPGDTNGDGLVDVADAVQIKLILAGTDFGKLAAKAADYDTDYDNEDEDLTNVRRTILGYEMAEKGEEMPIAGFWGPSRDYGYTDANGTVHYSQYDHITDEMYQLIADMGINEITYSQNMYTNSPAGRAIVYEMLTRAQNHGINMYVNDTRLDPATSYTSQELAEYLANYENFQSYAGVFLVDEPAGTSYPASYDADRPISDYGPLATAANNYKRGDVVVYANLLPYWLQMGKQSGIAGWFENERTAAGRYMEYIREYVDGFDMQYIGYDYYLFDDDNQYLEGDANVQTSGQYFKNMAMIRAVAKEKGLPFRPFVQAGSNWNDKMEWMSATTNNTPTEGEFKWNVTTSLAMGAQGIQYFTLMQPEWFALTEGGTYDYDRNGLIGANGEVNTWGEYATEINAHIADVDHVLMAATHEGVMASGGYAQSVATAAITDIYGKISTSTSNPVVTSYNEVTGISSSNSTYGALAGCFDYNGKTALYVSNYDANDSTADTITVNFSSAVNYTVIATTGTTSGNGSSASFSLGAGEGALIVLG